MIYFLKSSIVFQVKLSHYQTFLHSYSSTSTADVSLLLSSALSSKLNIFVAYTTPNNGSKI